MLNVNGDQTLYSEISVKIQLITTYQVCKCVYNKIKNTPLNYSSQQPQTRGKIIVTNPNTYVSSLSFKPLSSDDGH